MKYLASNGITGPVELTEAEAREHYERAQFVEGKFGGTFVICPVGQFGRVLKVAATKYVPVEDPKEAAR